MKLSWLSYGIGPHARQFSLHHHSVLSLLGRCHTRYWYLWLLEILERFLLRCLTDALIVGGSHTWVEGWTDAMWGISPHSRGLWPLSGLAPCLSQRGFMPITVAKSFLVSVSWCPICFLGSGSVSLCPCPPSPPGPLAGLQTLRLTSDPLVDLPCP